ncbi:MAG: hypothetical protein HQK69_09855 [Desulfamplus sp.]|nr:hypothetical protein [Desulfamplus sp.]
MKIDKQKSLKYILAMLTFVTILFWTRPIGQNSRSNEINSQYDQIIHNYELTKDTEQSDLKPILLKIIDKRLKCYENIADYSLRLSTCRKQYQYELLRAARDNLKSSPSLGDFMLCTENCPLAYSFCNGEDMTPEEDSQKCQEIEVLCVERCLDAFWRGNGFSDTYN